MAVPSWPIDNSSALLNLRPENHILQDFVDGMADMQRPVRIGRSIMENEGVVRRPVR